MASLWQHSSTQSEVVLMADKLRAIADTLGNLKDPDPADLSRLEQAVSDVGNRICMLRLDVEEPPSPSELARRY